MFNFLIFLLVFINSPEKINTDCLNTIYKIVQHESGSLQSDEVFRFMTEQIVQDLDIISCDTLTNWRWKIGNYNLSNVKLQVKHSVLTVINRWPYKEFPRCKFIGSMSDIKVWKKYGYNTEIGFSVTSHNLTVVGVDCTYKYKSKPQRYTGSRR